MESYDKNRTENAAPIKNYFVAVAFVCQISATFLCAIRQRPFLSSTEAYVGMIVRGAKKPRRRGAKKKLSGLGGPIR
jgi:hypothetical protein